MFIAAALALAMIVALFDACRVELVDDNVEILVGDVERKVTAAPGRFGHIAEFAHVIENHVLSRGQGECRHAALRFLHGAI